MSGETVTKKANFVCPHALFSQARSHIANTLLEFMFTVYTH